MAEGWEDLEDLLIARHPYPAPPPVGKRGVFVVVYQFGFKIWKRAQQDCCPYIGNRGFL
jgi:hypothetical protein